MPCFTSRRDHEDYINTSYPSRDEGIERQRDLENYIKIREENRELKSEIMCLKKELKEKYMPFGRPESSSDVEPEYLKSTDIIMDRGINREGDKLDFVTSLLCTHLRFLADHVKYADFMRLVQPEIKEWFDEHCKKEGGL